MPRSRSFKRTRPDGCVLAAIAAGEPFASEMPGREDGGMLPTGAPAQIRPARAPDRQARRAARRRLARRQRWAGGMGFLKLVAGMLGVGLDELVQRETTRRQRRLALAGGGVARRNGGHEHARDYRYPGARRCARAAAPGRRPGRIHARRSSRTSSSRSGSSTRSTASARACWPITASRTRAN